MKDRMHDDAMAEMYREDPAYAVQLLNSILEEGDPALSSFSAILKAMGLRLAVQSVQAPPAHT